MALSELYGSRQVTYLRHGAYATREFYGTWSEAFNDSPKPGDAYPYTGWEALTVDKTTITPAGEPGSSADYPNEYTHARVRCDYTMEYDKPVEEDETRISVEASSEILATTSGRTWTTTSEIVDPDELQCGVLYPLLSITMSGVLKDPPLELILSLIGKVNAAEFAGMPAGTVLFEGAVTDANYDYENSSWKWRVTYKFLYRAQGHNYVWRPPQKVYAGDGSWEYAPGDAGKGDWDTTDPLLYEYGDFSLLSEADV